MRDLAEDIVDRIVFASARTKNTDIFMGPIRPDGGVFPQDCIFVMTTGGGGSIAFINGISPADGPELLDDNKAFENWVNIRVSTTPNTAVDPDGGMLADTIKEDGTAGITHYVRNSFSAVAGARYEWSCYLKAINRFRATIQTQINPVMSTSFNLNNLSGINSVTAPADSFGIEDHGNGWRRCWITFTVTVTGTQSCFAFLADDLGATSFDGLNQDSLYAYNGTCKSISQPSLERTPSAQIMMRSSVDNIGAAITEMRTIRDLLHYKHALINTTYEFIIVREPEPLMLGFDERGSYLLAMNVDAEIQETG